MLAAYRACSSDNADIRVIRFYQASRALMRAKLAAWHLEDHPGNNARALWLARARAYLRSADEHANMP